MKTPMSIWFERLESYCWQKFGLGIHGLPKFDWVGYYKGRASVNEAVEGFERVYPTYARMYGKKIDGLTTRRYV